MQLFQDFILSQWLILIALDTIPFAHNDDICRQEIRSIVQVPFHEIFQSFFHSYTFYLKKPISRLLSDRYQSIYHKLNYII